MNIQDFATTLAAVIRHNRTLLSTGWSVKDYLVPMAWGDPGLGNVALAEAGIAPGHRHQVVLDAPAGAQQRSVMADDGRQGGCEILDVHRGASSCLEHPSRPASRLAGARARAGATPQPGPLRRAAGMRQEILSHPRSDLLLSFSRMNAAGEQGSGQLRGGFT